MGEMCIFPLSLQGKYFPTFRKRMCSIILVKHVCAVVEYIISQFGCRNFPGI